MTGVGSRRSAVHTGDAAVPGSRALGSLRVLLAEDNPLNQMVARGILEKRGSQVDTAVDGAEALAAWEAGDYDLILMNVQMPKMDGYEVTHATRQSERQLRGRTPIIGLTANAMKGDRELCLQAGMDGYVAKPVRSEALFEEIDRVLSELRKAR